MSRRTRTFDRPTEDAAFKFPLHYSARSYQWEFYAAMRAGCKRAALVWHRRGGKDITTLNWTIESMITRPGVYNYFFPTYKLGKRILWDGQQADGRPFLSHFPQHLLVGKNETEMKITLSIGDGHNADCPDQILCPGRHSIFQILGADEADSTSVGTNPIGCVFSEYSLMDPKAWNLTRPILAENGGWAVFVYTPRGKNHGWTLWKHALKSTDWFASLKTCDDTRRDAQDENDTVVISPKAIQDERASGMAEELVQQEFYCSFEGALLGAYYSDQLKAAYNEGRVCRQEYDPKYQVDTAWDFGIDDATAIWFTQTIAGKCRVVDYLESSSHGLGWYIERMRLKPYAYGRHYVPHDAKVREYSTGKTRVQFAQSMGVTLEAVPKLPIEDGINAGRMLLPLSTFDDTENDSLVVEEHQGKSVLYEGCSRGLAALASYCREFDEKNATWRNVPKHDWASHGADAWRTRAVAWQVNLGGTVQDWARTLHNMHGPLEQEQAETFTPPSRRLGANTREQVAAQTEVERGDDWWR